MKQLFFFATVFTISVAISCGSNSDEAKTETPAATTPVNTNADTTIIPVNSPVVSTIPAPTTVPVTADKMATPTNITPVTTIPQPTKTTATTTAGLNPAHGQPGHRCDISVGAPLNSSSTTANTPSIAQKPITVSSPQIATVPNQPAAVAPGMNPAHGQPGHRCDISVGAPLNSAPATKPSTSTTPAPVKN